MFDLVLRMVSHHTQAQRAAYVTPCVYVGLNVSGLRYWRRLGQDIRMTGPHIALTPADTEIEFEYDEQRDNWVVSIDTPDLRAGLEAGQVELRCGGAWVALPAVTPVAQELLPAWQEEFVRMHEDFRKGDGRSLLRVRTGVANVLRHVLDRNAPSGAATPVGRLRRRLAGDLQGRLSVAELAVECGYSEDHLRRVFTRAYGITPVAFRNRQRMAAAMDLVSGSRLSVKEIGHRVGFEHASHFAAMFRAAFGLPPTAAVRAYRGNSG